MATIPRPSVIQLAEERCPVTWRESLRQRRPDVLVVHATKPIMQLVLQRGAIGDRPSHGEGRRRARTTTLAPQAIPGQTTKALAAGAAGRRRILAPVLRAGSAGTSSSPRGPVSRWPRPSSGWRRRRGSTSPPVRPALAARGHGADGAGAGLAGLVGGVAGLAFSRRRLRFLAVTLVALAGLSAPLAVTGVTLATLNDWNFANRAFIGALFPVIAAELDGDLPQVTTTTHRAIHHSRQLPTGGPAPRTTVAGPAARPRDGATGPDRPVPGRRRDDQQRVGGNGATDGRLVFALPPARHGLRHGAPRDGPQLHVHAASCGWPGGLEQRRYFFESLGEDVWRAAQGAEAIIYKRTWTAGYSIAEKLEVPCAAVAFFPLTPTREFPSFLVGGGRALGPLLDRLAWRLTEQVVWQTTRRDDARLRRDVLRLRPLPLRGPGGRQDREGLPLFYAYSSTVLPPPADWPASIHVPESFFSEPPPSWRPSAELVDFLEMAPPRFTSASAACPAKMSL